MGVFDEGKAYTISIHYFLQSMSIIHLILLLGVQNSIGSATLQNNISVPAHFRDNGSRLSPPTSEIGVRFPAPPQMRQLVVVCRRLAVYSTEP